jgi:antitoxin component YwqK of YwqJK toxin-antitoxin module
MTLFTGISTFYYDNNQIRIRQTFKNGKKHSLHKS